jgi:hypothetical protein
MVVPTLMDNPAHWRARAEESRVLADQMNDPESKRTMLGIADGYDRMAERAEERMVVSGTVAALVPEQPK